MTVGEQADGTLKIELASDPREDWLRKRRDGLGGSDAAAVLGLSPWKSQLALWSEKTGLVQGEDIGDIEYVEWGNILEEPIARKYVAVTGRTLIDHGRYAIRFGPSPVMHCTIDREIIKPGDKPLPVFPFQDGSGDLSIKNTSEYKLKDWEEEAPLPYQIQLQHELAVTGLLWGSFAVLIGGNKFRWMDVPRNDKFISYLVEQEEAFWDKVVRGIPPEADASDSTKEVLSRLYPKDTGESRALPPDAEEWASKLAEAKAAIKVNGALEQEMENKLKAAIGDATFGVLPSGERFSWKWQARKGYVVSDTEFRVLRRLKK